MSRQARTGCSKPAQTMSMLVAEVSLKPGCSQGSQPPQSDLSPLVTVPLMVDMSQTDLDPPGPFPHPELYKYTIFESQVL